MRLYHRIFAVLTFCRAKRYPDKVTAYLIETELWQDIRILPHLGKVS